MILITGGLGYLGGRFAEHLIKIGLKVRISSSRENPNVPVELNSCEIVKIDFNDNNSIEHACNNVSCILHFAALNSMECEKEPESALLVNSLGTLRLLKLAIKTGVSKFLYISTAHVYGSFLSGLIDEKTLPRPSNHYAITHKIAEDYVINFNDPGKFNTCIFRLTNAVGSPLSQNNNCWTLITNDLCKKIAMNEKPIIHSNKNITRDFVPIQDVIDSSLYFINSVDNRLSGEIINISSGKSTSLEQLCDLLVERAWIKLGKKVTIKYSDLENKKNVHRYFISNKKASTLGLKCSNRIPIEIDLLLENCYKWFSNS